MIAVDNKKITLDEVKSRLEKEGFKRTTSRRFIRYEREAKVSFTGVAYTEGVEVEKYSIMFVISGYTRQNIGDIIPLDACSKLNMYVDNLFEDCKYNA